MILFLFHYYLVILLLLFDLVFPPFYFLLSHFRADLAIFPILFFLYKYFAVVLKINIPKFSRSTRRAPFDPASQSPSPSPPFLSPPSAFTCSQELPFFSFFFPSSFPFFPNQILVILNHLFLFFLFFVLFHLSFSLLFSLLPIPISLPFLPFNFPRPRLLIVFIHKPQTAQSFR